MRIGLDTGFFVRLLQENVLAQNVWDRIVRGEAEGVISCITLYELHKQGLKGLIPRTTADTLVEELPHICMVIWIDEPSLLHRAARVAHGNGLAMADAIILASLIRGGAEEVYTTDSDLSTYPHGPTMVSL